MLIESTQFKNCTIGFGHLISRNATCLAPSAQPKIKAVLKKANATPDGCITRDGAKKLMEEKLKKEGMEKAVRKVLQKYRVTQSIFDSLVDFVYNSGAGTFLKWYDLQNAIKDEKVPWEDVANLMKTFCKSHQKTCIEHPGLDERKKIGGDWMSTDCSN